MGYRASSISFSIPLNGQKTIEVTNMDTVPLKIHIRLFSYRYELIDSIRGTYEHFDINDSLNPSHSLLFRIKDKGPLTNTKHLEFRSHEGVLRVSFGPTRDESHFLADFDVSDEPPTEAYKKFKKELYNSITWCLEKNEPEPWDEKLKVELIADNKYGKGMPSKVRYCKLSDEDKKYNEEYKTQIEARIKNRRRRRKKYLAIPDSDDKKPEVSKENLKKNQSNFPENPSQLTSKSENPKSKNERSRSGNDSELSIQSGISSKKESAAPSKSDKSTKPEKSSCQSKSTKSTMKTERSHSEFGRNVNKLEDMKKKKKKKKRCVIS